MATSAERMPTFRAAQSTISPSVRGLLDDPLLIENGKKPFYTHAHANYLRYNETVNDAVFLCPRRILLGLSEVKAGGSTNAHKVRQNNDVLLQVV